MSHPRLDDAQMLIPDALESHGTYFRDKDAVVCGPVRRNWGDFNRNINRVANALLQHGVGRSSKVAVLMGNSVEMLEILFGIVKAGACAVPLSGLLTGDQLVDLVNDSGAILLFASPEFRFKLTPALPRLKSIAFDSCIAVFGSAESWQTYEMFVAEASTGRPAAVCSPVDDFNIIYSSGTTGLPKGIVQTHRARLHWAVSNALEMGITARSRGLTTTSLYSNGTWLIMLPVLFAGGTLVVMPSFGTTDFLETVARERITHTFMVPTQFGMLLDEGNIPRHETSSLEVILSAGSPLRQATKFEVIRQFGDKLIELYGFSEGFATMLKSPHHQSKPDSVGTPVIGFEVRIVDDEGNALPAGQLGEIAGYGAGMMKEYHGRPEATADLIWRDERGRTFIRSGDIGVLDEDGFLKIVDRKKDMIISGGFNVFASDIEQVIAEHPAVADVAVIGVPHPKWGETPLAVVARRSGATESAEDIALWVNQRLAKHQRIAGVEFLAEFPRNALGKVLKRVLRDTFAGDKGVPP